MKIDIVQIKDTSSNKYFVFMKQFTGVCAQGDSKEEANSKVKSYFKAYIEKVQKNEVEYSESEYSI